jgi:hypothetical protein
LERICVLCELTPTQYRNAEEKYKAVGSWLAFPGSTLAQFAPVIYPQGSMRLGTTVRPYNCQHEYDLDLVCQLHGCGHQSPMTIYRWVQNRLAANQTYKEILEPLKRCLRLNYAGAFHLDILPACPNELLANGAILVPDRKLECWKDSNPQGFATWFFARCIVRDAIAECELKASVEPLPSAVPSEHKYPLQRIVQLMKRHRDIFFMGGRDIARSVILTTLAGDFYRGQRSLSLALESVLDGIHAALEQHPTVPRIENPVHCSENFADTWDQEKYDKFRAYIRNFRVTFKRALHPSLIEERKGLESLSEPLGTLFGSDRVGEAIRQEAADLNASRNTSRLGISSAGILSTLTASPKVVPVTRNQFYGR